MAKKSKNSFEVSLRRLQEISDLLESEDVELDEMIKLYEEGIILSELCYNTLNKAEVKITELNRELEKKLSGNR